MNAQDEKMTGMRNGYEKIFWGMLVLLFHVNLGTISFLPNFPGFILIAFGIDEIRRYKGADVLKRAASTAYLTVMVSFVDFLTSTINLLPNQDLISLGITAMVSIASIVLFNDLLKETREFMDEIGNSKLSSVLNKQLKVFLVVESITTVLVLTSIFTDRMIALAGVIISIIVRIWIMISIHKVKKVINSK